VKIRISVELPADNEIQFYDVCHGVSHALQAIGSKALNDGDHQQFAGTRHRVVTVNDDAEDIGEIVISK
jgi:hypothetical protein